MPTRFPSYCLPRHKSWSERLSFMVCSTILGGWLLMLAVGVIHHEWIHSCPTIGFGWSVLLSSLIKAALINHTSCDYRSTR